MQKRHNKKGGHAKWWTSGNNCQRSQVKSNQEFTVVEGKRGRGNIYRQGHVKLK